MYLKLCKCIPATKDTPIQWECEIDEGDKEASKKNKKKDAQKMKAD